MASWSLINCDGTQGPIPLTDFPHLGGNSAELPLVNLAQVKFTYRGVNLVNRHSALLSQLMVYFLAKVPKLVNQARTRRRERNFQNLGHAKYP